MDTTGIFLAGFSQWELWTRTLTLVIDRPYIGLSTDSSWGTNKTFSWTEEPCHQIFINACWEVYGADDSRHLPGNGASYYVEIQQPAPGSFELQSEWEQDQGKFEGCPSSIVREHHNEDKYSTCIWIVQSIRCRD
jgi:hypothetical protein